jgi:MoaA/NifB/PqqE/SkfB family radical SAM enzyme
MTGAIVETITAGHQQHHHNPGQHAATGTESAGVRDFTIASKGGAMNYMALKAKNKALNTEEILAGKVRLKSKPVSFSFEICGPCNLKCVHCGFQVFGRTSNQQVSEEVYSEVISELMPTAYICNLGGSNWGEMTIAKHFHRFLLDAKKFGVRINLTTNGTRLLDEWFDDLLDTVAVIGFSMEGISDEFEKIRGFRWRHFLKNVEKVCQGRADRRQHFRVEWRYCAHAESIHQLPDMIRLAKRVGVDRIQVMNLVPYVASQKYKSLFYHRSLANQYFTESRRVADELNFDVNIPPDFAVGDFRKSTPLQIQGAPPSVGTLAQADGHWLSGAAPTMVHCYRPWQTCVVDELGNVRPSSVYWKSMGNLHTNDFASIWNGRKYRRLRASINTKPDGICHSCRMPQFDSEENRAAMQLMPSVKQRLTGVAKSLLAGPQVTFAGIMDKEFDPHHNDVSS